MREIPRVVPVQSVDEVLITEELSRRPSRVPNYVTENRALTVLADAVAQNPQKILDKLAELALSLCQADSAGVSILEEDGDEAIFRWHAIAGAWARYIGRTLPHHDSPCGFVTDRNRSQLFHEPARFFHQLQGLEPPLYEVLMVPFSVRGEPVGTLWAVSHRPEHRFDAEDERLLSSLSHFAAAAHSLSEHQQGSRNERVAALNLMEDAILAREETEQSSAALRESEEKYRSLFTSMDEGYAVVEVLADENGMWNDFLFLEVNPAFVKQTGMEYPVGHKATELLGTPNPHWAQIYGRVAETGEPVRFEESEPMVGRVFDLYCFRLEGTGSRRVAVIFNDISERKQREEQQQYLLKLSDGLRPLSDAVEIQNTATRILGEHLPVDRVQYSDVDEKQGHWVVVGSYLREGATPLVGSGRVKDFGWGSEEHRSGKTISIADAATDASLSPTTREAFLAIQARAVLSVPLIKEGQWVATLSLHHSSVHKWSEEEINLAQETAERTWAAVERAHAEAALRQSEEQFRRAIEEAPIPIIMHAEDGQVLQISRTWTEMTGYTPEDIPHFEAWLNTAYGHGADVVRSYMQELFKGDRRHLNIEMPIQTRSGQERHWSFSASAPGTLHDGRRFIVGMAVDITERKRAEEALRESEKRLRIALQAAQLATWHWNLVENTVEWNEHHYRLLGLKPDGQLQKAERFEQYVHPDDRDWVMNSLQKAIDERSVYSEEFRVVLPDTSTRWMTGYGQVVEEENGRATHMSGVMYDSTERRAAEEALRESEERFRILVEGAKDYAMFLMDTDRRIVHWNSGAERIFGYAKEEAIGQSGDMIFTPEDCAAGGPEEETQIAVREGRALDLRWHIRKDGSRFWSDGINTSLKDEAGNLRGFVKITRDATREKQAEEELKRAHDELEQRVLERTASLRTEIIQRKEAERTREHLLQRIVTLQEEERSRISRELHDQMGQLLTALMVGLKSLGNLVDSENQPTSSSQQVEYLQTIGEELMEQMHQLAWELRPSALDTFGLEPALRQYVENWAEQSGIAADFVSRGLRKNSRINPEVETAFYRMTQEALTNVQRHAGARGVSLVLERRDGHLVLVIEDNGHGFDVESAIKKSRRLGITGMRERLALIGGSLDIESSRDGTTVYARAPLK
jgi:PAS domain S-box-containing protein